MPYTRGALRPENIDRKSEIFCYYPMQGDGQDFLEPFVVAITPLSHYIEQAIIDLQDHRKPLPVGLSFEWVKIDGDFAERAMHSGAAERPLVNNAKKFMQNGGEAVSCMLYAVSSPVGVNPVCGTLIDGMHRYCAAYELGIPSLFSAYIREPLLHRFCIGGVDYAFVKQALGQGADDTTRLAFEVRKGWRNPDGSPRNAP